MPSLPQPIFAPLSVLSRYLTRQFLGIFLPVLLSFVLLYIIIDTFDRMDIFLRHDATFGEAARYMLFKVPLMLTQITPPAVVVGVLLGLGLIARHNEIIAFRTGGISLVQTMVPIMVCAVAISGAALVWNETVVPYCSRMFQYVNNVEIRERGMRGIFQEREIWYHGGSGFYNIDYVDRASQTVHGLRIYRFADIDDGFRLRSVFVVPEAKWDRDRWIFSPESSEQILDEATPRSREITGDSLLLPESVEDFLEVQREPEELSYAALGERIADLTAKGIDASHYLVDLHLKLALPFANAVLAFVAIPIAGRLRRHPSIAAIVGIGAAVGFLYWVILGLATSLGQTGTLPPLLAAWSANVVYTLLGVALYLYAE
jgi:lipopolysaccharide export system permease protein